MVEDDIIAREDMRKLTENRLSSFNINFANNAIKAAVTPLPEKILGAESVHNTHSEEDNDK